MNMTTLNLSGTTALTELENLSDQLNTLTSLTLDGTNLGSSVTDLDFSSNTSITTLSLTNFPDTAVTLPTNGGSITSLTLNNVKTDSLDLSALNALTTLSLVNLSGTDLTLPSSNTGITTLTLDNLDFDSINLSGMTGLTTINLKNMPKGFHVDFGNNTTTTTLDMTGSDLSGFADGQIEGNFDKLATLTLNNTNISTFSSKRIKNISTLTKINLNNNTALESVEFKDDGNALKHIVVRNCPELREITIEDNGKVEWISIDNNKKLTTEGLRLAEEYKTLYMLEVGNTGLTGTLKIPKFNTTPSLLSFQ